MLRKTLLAAGIAAALLAGAPAPSMAAGPVGASEQPTAAAAWWQQLGDPVLAGLVERGLSANHDVAQALARLDRARALEQGARAESGPAGGARLQAASALASESQAPGLSRAQRRSEPAQLGLEFSWELDLFGRLRAQSSAAAQRVAASQAEAEGIRVAISAEIAHAYFDALGAREQLALARATVANRESTLKLVASRARHGLSAPIDEARAQADLEAAHVDVPRWEAAEQVATHRLAVLVAEAPATFALPREAAAPAAVAQLAIPPASTWLARRPDIQAHEAELRARSLDVAAVRAEFYPRLTVGGFLGFIAGSASAIGSGGSLSWLAGPSLLAPLFDRPKIEARLAAAKAGEKELLAAYRQRILLALEEVENATVRYAAGQRQLQAQERRARHAQQAERLARLRYEAGAADMLELLDAQRSAQQATAALADALTGQRQGLVAVLRGVAGGA